MRDKSTQALPHTLGALHISKKRGTHEDIQAHIGKVGIRDVEINMVLEILQPAVERCHMRTVFKCRSQFCLRKRKKGIIKMRKINESAVARSRQKN